MKPNMRNFAAILAFLLILCSCCSPPSNLKQLATKKEEKQGESNGPRSIPALPYEPITYKDEKTGMLFYLEGNGTNMAGIDKEGTILWYKDLTKDVTEKRPPMGQKLRVTSLGKVDAKRLKELEDLGKGGDYLGIGLNTSEGGLINQKTGEYIFNGVRRNVR
jgi:hypothetical protein